MTILLTGATGFLGSHLLKAFVRKGYKVVALKRTTSDIWRLKGFENTFKSYDLNTVPLRTAFEEQHINAIIHTAWAGVASAGRNDWEVQMENFYFSKELIDLSAEFNIRKVICLGSQAEYGNYTEKVTEICVPNPIGAYACVKLLVLHYLMNIAQQVNINWFWIRVFSILGENENDSWLLSQVIKHLYSNKSVQLTAGEQYYDYMYAEDFVLALEKVLITQYKTSGVYNLCSGNPVKIKDILYLVTDVLQKDRQLLQFGVLPYRAQQNMFMVGNPQKFEKTFGKIALQPLSITIDKIVKSYTTSIQ